MTLYDINEQLLRCMKIDEESAVDTETGEVLDIEQLEALEMERDAKIEGIACWIKNLKAEAEALKAEKMSFEKRQKAADNKAESLKSYLTAVLDGNKFKSDKCEISFRKSQKVNVIDVYQVPEDFVKFKEPEVDKVLVKKCVKEGQIIPGIEIVDSVSTIIK